VINEVEYRRLPGSKLGEEDYLQLLVPNSDVEEVLHLCHAGKEVDGSMMAEVCKHFDITRLRTLPDKPSTNQVERFHKTTNATLAKTVSEAQRDWDDQLPFVLAAYRAMKHNSTGFIPNRFVLGREVLAPIDVVYGSIDDEDQWIRQYKVPYLVTRIPSLLTVGIQRSAKSRPKKVHTDKLKNFVGSPPLDRRSPSFRITADENEVSDTRFATVGASSVSVAWPASTAKDAGGRWKELQGNVGARSDGIPVAAVKKPAEKKPPSYTVDCSEFAFVKSAQLRLFR